MALKLYLNLDLGTVSFDQAGLTGFSGLALNQGDNLAVSLWFTRTVNTAERVAVVPLPSPYTLIALAGRDAKNLDDPTDELFGTGDWTAVTETLEDETTETHYEATLSMRRPSLDTWLGTGADNLQKAALWSITLTDGADAEWTPLIRANATVYRDLHRADGDDVGVAPTDYPAADQIAPITGTNFRFYLAGGGGYLFQIKNTTTGTFHSVHIEGASGSEVLVLETGI